VSWENVKTLLQIVEYARDHGPALKELHDHAIAVLAAVDVNALYHQSQVTEGVEE